MLTAKPSKQRRLVHLAPDHVRYKMFAAPLSDALIASQGIKTLPVRSGDTIRVMRGDHKGFEGKVTRVNRREYRVYVEGLTREKVDGTTVFVALHPSKVLITNLNLDDKWRKKIIDRKKGVAKKGKKEKPARKTPEKVVETPPPAAKPLEIEEKEEKIVKEKPKKAVRRSRKTGEKSVAKRATVKKTEEEKPTAKPKKSRIRRKGTETEGGE